MPLAVAGYFRDTDRPDSLRDRLTLRHQRIDLAQLRHDLLSFRTASFPSPSLLFRLIVAISLVENS